MKIAQHSDKAHKDSSARKLATSLLDIFCIFSKKKVNFLFVQKFENGGRNDNVLGEKGRE